MQLFLPTIWWLDALQRIKENKNLTPGECWSASKQHGPDVVQAIFIQTYMKCPKKEKKKTISSGYNVCLSKLWKIIYLSN